MPAFVGLIIRLLVYGVAMLTGVGTTTAATKLLEKRKARKELAREKARQRKIAEMFK